MEQQKDKLFHIQASEILGHIRNRDYGLAEVKTEILWRCLIEKQSN